MPPYHIGKHTKQKHPNNTADKYNTGRRTIDPGRLLSFLTESVIALRTVIAAHCKQCWCDTSVIILYGKVGCTMCSKLCTLLVHDLLLEELLGKSEDEARRLLCIDETWWTFEYQYYIESDEREERRRKESI